MLQAWRIVKEKHAATAFSGEGAAKVGGRWNSRGVSVVYVSSTLSLAALENLVHLNPPVLFKYVAFPIEFDDALVTSSGKLPKDWEIEPPGPASKSVGDAWVRAGKSAVLAVPTVIIPSETNYLLNPVHSDFKKITFGKPRPFAFDQRLL